MIVAVDYKGGLIIRDSEGLIHKFCPDEARIIGKAWYTYVQKKRWCEIR